MCSNHIIGIERRLNRFVYCRVIHILVANCELSGHFEENSGFN